MGFWSWLGKNILINIGIILMVLTFFPLYNSITSNNFNLNSILANPYEIIYVTVFFIGLMLTIYSLYKLSK